MRTLILLAACALVACDDDTNVDAHPDAGPVADAGDVDAGPEADAGPEGDAAPDVGPDAMQVEPLELDPFVVRVGVDPQIGVVGQLFTIEATPGEMVPGPVTFSWTAETGEVDGASDEATIRVSFAEPGPHEIVVMATSGGASVEAGALVVVYEAGPQAFGDVDGDGDADADDVDRLAAHLDASESMDDEEESRADVNRDGEVDEVDAALLEQAAAGEPIIALQPERGSRGTAIQVIHPLLLDPGAAATLSFDDEEVPVTRGPPGYALLVVPLEAGAAAGARITLTVGDESHDFAFQVLDPPEVTGNEVVTAYSQLQTAVDAMPMLIEPYLLELELPEAERGVLMATMQAVSHELRTERARFEMLWGELSPEQQAAYAEVAMANGLGDALTELQTLLGRIQSMQNEITPATSARIIELICIARDVGKVAKIISRVNNIAGYVIDALWFLSFFVPPLAPIVAGLGTLNTLIGAVMDVLQMIVEFLPTFGRTLEVKAMEAMLERGETATITVALPMHIGGGLCAGGAALATKLLLDRMKKALFKRIFGRIPGFGKIYRRARGQRTIIARIVNTIARFLGQIIDVLVEASGIDRAIKEAARAICNAIAPGTPLPLDAKKVLEQASCGALDEDKWKCEADCGDRRVAIKAKTEVCGKSVEGFGAIECAGCRAECPDGCCTGAGECIGVPDQSEERCGNSGSLCLACDEDQRCEDGRCRCISTCEEGEVGNKRCNEAGTHAETCETAGEDCWRWTSKDCSAGGAMCEDGECVGGCGDWNCEGCCTGEHECVPQADQSEMQCGRAGGACRGCAEGDECIGGACVCRGAHCDPCHNGCSRGDPHLVTFDGLAYDFQAAGEFVFVTAPDGAEIQVRQVPLGGVCGHVSLTKAVAARVGEVRVTYVASRERPLWVDGVAVAPPAHEPWPLGDGTLTAWDGGASIEWPDGTRLVVDDRTSFLDVAVRVAEARRGMVGGLLGDANGDAEGDLRIRDGDPLPAPVPFETLYGAFADSWRVDADTSEFEYDPGEGPETYAIAGFPGELGSVDDLPEDTRAAATALCEDLGIEDEVLLTDCVLDVACSGGDAAYAAGFVDADGPDSELEVLPPEAGEVPRDCFTAPRDISEEVGTIHDFDCPPGCPANSPVWGTDVYTHDSAICASAAHAGRILLAVGGPVRFELTPGLDAYEGSSRNGIESRPWPAWGVSFIFLDP